MKHERIVKLGMLIASSMAEMSRCQKTRVGVCILDRYYSVIATGYNGPLTGLPNCVSCCGKDNKCTVSVHAEANAICQAAKRGTSLLGSHVFCTRTPCRHCSMLLIQTGISSITCPSEEKYWPYLSDLCKAAEIELHDINRGYLHGNKRI